MKRSRIDRCTCWHAYHHVHVLSPAVVELGCLIANLCHGFCHKVTELHFNHGLESSCTQANSCTNDGGFTNGRVSHTALAIRGRKAICRLEYAAVIRDVLPHQHKVLMTVHALP